ncbi:YbaK/EbsC family protein [bacterium]|nr:MAG: YbaK/EbsC family protein [bacterium]
MLIYSGEKKVVEALEAAGLKPAVSRFPRGTETAEASAREIGVQVARIIKSMIVSADGKPVLALLPGDRRADLKAISKFVGARKVRLAHPEQVIKWTGFPVGAVPPVGHSKSILILLDESIPADGDIFPAAGEKNNAFRTTFTDLLRITGGKVCRISSP